MNEEHIWYIVSIADQIRNLLLIAGVLLCVAVLARYRYNHVYMGDTPSKGYTLYLIGVLACLSIRAVLPSAQISKEIAAIKYGRELQQKRVQDKIYFWKKELNKNKENK